ncbi:hypothetical protein D3C79_1086790 [compost metagenome]
MNGYRNRIGPVTTMAIAILVDSVGRSLPRLTPVPAPMLAIKAAELMTLYRWNCS